MIERSREFQILAAHLNFTTAARELNESQSSLSRHIVELEQSLGFKLLDRSPVQLTAAGKRYLEEISQVLEHFDTVVEQCRGIARLERKSLSVSMVPADDVVSYAVYDTLARMHDVYPNFDYQMEANRKLTIEQAVEDGLADVGIVYHRPDTKNGKLKLEWVFDNPFCALLHEANPLAHRPIQFAELSSCTVVLSANRKLQTWIEGMRDACERYGCTPAFKMKEFESVTDCLVSLRDNEVVFGSSSSDSFQRLNAHLRRADLIDANNLCYPVSLLYRADNENPALKTFIELFHEDAKQRAGEASVSDDHGANR